MIQYDIAAERRITWIINNRLMLHREAADYTGTAPKYLGNQAKTGRLAYILTSPRRMMFQKDDLDAWMQTWKKVEVAAR